MQRMFGGTRMLLAAAAAALLMGGAVADVYMHNPRGSNNKLSEASNNVNNNERLFDSQNNGEGGYQIGDDCDGPCMDEGGTYDPTKPGAMKGTATYYQGSELYVEWTMQHGCGVGSPNVKCQVILQYMCDSDNSGLRDGTERGNANRAGGEEEPPTAETAADPDGLKGEHEPLEFYLQCRQRERNRGLYTADRTMNDDRGATATRQNQNGNGQTGNNNRNGLECPEERDYYPYWHPTPWHDIAVFTDEPETRCEYYRQESQNVRARGFCYGGAEFNNPSSCAAGGGEWREVWSGPRGLEDHPPECFGGPQSRDNHLGNVRMGRPYYYLWKIPEYVQGRCVLRIRYNITTDDFDRGSQANPGTSRVLEGDVTDYFFVDSRYNGENAILKNDPSDDYLNLFPDDAPASSLFVGMQLEVRPGVSFQPNGEDYYTEGDKGRVSRALYNDGGNDVIDIAWERTGRTSAEIGESWDSKFQVVTHELQIQVNTNQYGRTFEDRSHSFLVRPRPDSVPSGARIVNYNVRGRRGNIVQTYPAVEYDFVPQDLEVEQGDYLHFQFVGADSNANNAGNGKARTDRSNLVQIAARGESVPLPIEEHTLLFDSSDGITPEDRRLVDKFAYLDQTNCDPDENNANAVTNCKQLNAASAYFNGGLVEMKTIGEHHIVSTRNSDFSNRSQKATITVIRRLWQWYALTGIIVFSVGLAALALYLAIAVYALKHPGSWLFSKRFRPRVLRCLVRRETLEARLEERRAINREKRSKWAEMMASADVDVEATVAGGKTPGGVALARPTKFSGQSWASRCVRLCARCGLGEQRLTTVLYTLVNLFVFGIGSLSNLTRGFQGSWAYPLAKGAGYTMDLNFAVLVLPTLKSLQTAMRRAGTSKEWMPIDDPIAFHITVAAFILVGSAVHVACHCVHIWTIASAPDIYEDPLDHWHLSIQEQISGTSYLWQIFDYKVRFAAISGVVLIVLMGLMCSTALPCVRRSSSALSRRLGGYNLFWRLHMCWPWVYVLLLLHAPTRLWIWFFFPAIIVAADRMMLERHQKLHASLRNVKLLPRDVIGLTFDVPKSFTYQAGQYILLGWNNEWHPFTLTSAPEENKLSVHIRAPDSLDWCSALRRRLTVGAPDIKAKPGDVIEYSKHIHPGSSVLYCRPALRAESKDAESNDMGDQDLVYDVDSGRSVQQAAGEQAAAEPGEARARPAAAARRLPVIFGRKASDDGLKVQPVATEAVPDYTRGDTMVSRVNDGELPKDAVVLQITGPFGAPAQKVWSFDTIMVVGAGIGVTPFASILRSVQLRTQQRETILRAARSRQAEPGATESLEHLVNDVINVPKKIYFYWIVRSQEEFDWFYDILKDAVEGPAKGITEITVFLTGEIELSKVRGDLEFASGGQFFGRPNWARIFKQNREHNLGQHVGVFLCGSPAIGAELSRQSGAHSDAPGTPGGTRFSFFKEHF